MLKFGTNYTPEKLYKRVDRYEVVHELEEEGTGSIIAKRNRRIDLIDLKIHSEEKQKVASLLSTLSSTQDNSPGAPGSSS